MNMTKEGLRLLYERSPYKNYPAKGRNIDIEQYIKNKELTDEDLWYYKDMISWLVKNNKWV